MGIFSWMFQGVWTKGFNLRSYTGVMLVNSLRIKRTNRPLWRAYKRLKNNYNSEAIGRLFEKRAKAKASLSAKKSLQTIESFQSDLEKLILNFRTDCNIFKEYMAYCFKGIQAIFVSGERQENKNIGEVGNLFLQMYAKRAQLVFPKTTVEKFKTESLKLLKHLEKGIAKEGSSTTRVQRGGHPAGVSIFSPLRWWSLGKLYVKEKRTIRKLGRCMEFFDNLDNQLQAELAQGVRQDFLLLFIELLKRADAADKRFEFIYLDLQEIVARLKKEVETVKLEVSNFLALLANEPAVQKKDYIALLQQDIQMLESYINNLEGNVYKNTQALLRNLRKIESDESGLMKVMQQYAR